MAATTTPPISWVVEQLLGKYPDLLLQAGDDFSWRPDTQTITYPTDGEAATLLHEVGHALLEHKEYARDIKLIGMETAAWEKARHIAKTLAISLDEDLIESHLDSYRDWLHARSRCISCGQTGVETSKRHYTCLACGSTWRVNDARQCQLKRYRLTT